MFFTHPFIIPDISTKDASLITCARNANCQAMEIDHVKRTLPLLGFSDITNHIPFAAPCGMGEHLKFSRWAIENKSWIHSSGRCGLRRSSCCRLSCSCNCGRRRVSSRISHTSNASIRSWVVAVHNIYIEFQSFWTGIWNVDTVYA